MSNTWYCSVLISAPGDWYWGGKKKKKNLHWKCVTKSTLTLWKREIAVVTYIRVVYWGGPTFFIERIKITPSEKAQNLLTPSEMTLIPFNPSVTHSLRTSLYSDCLRRESNFLASTRQVTALRVSVCCIISKDFCIAHPDLSIHTFQSYNIRIRLYCNAMKLNLLTAPNHLVRIERRRLCCADHNQWMLCAH